jgi:hypothetical protein
MAVVTATSVAWQQPTPGDPSHSARCNDIGYRRYTAFKDRLLYIKITMQKKEQTHMSVELVRVPPSLRRALNKEDVPAIIAG